MCGVAFRKILCATLALALLLSCCGAECFAATAQTVKQYGAGGGYLAFGDSYSRGCGATGFYLDNDRYGEGGQYAGFELRNVEGAVSYQIAQAVGCSAPRYMTDPDANYWPMCYPGLTMAMTLDLLGIEDNFTDTALDYPYYDEMLQYFGWDGAFVGAKGETCDPAARGQCGNIMELIETVDLITVELGMADTFYRTYRIASGSTLTEGFDFSFDNLSALTTVIGAALKELIIGFRHWKTYYPVLIQTLQKMNPDATIVSVGAFNLLAGLTLTDDLTFPLGSIFDGVTEEMNRLMRGWAKEYGILFADISNVETLAAEKEWSVMGDFMANSFTATHPGQNGYDYITRRILDVLPEQTAGGDPRDLCVDLGRFTKADVVLLNGVPVRHYTVQDHILTVPFDGRIAKSLCVGIRNDDGTMAAQIYRVSLLADGYRAFRVYGTNDVGGKLETFGNNVSGFLRTAAEKLAGAFRK